MTTLRTPRLTLIPPGQVSRLAVALALGFAACAPAHALRLSHSRVVSAPNAPLEVLVGISDLSADEQFSLTARLADAAAWKQAGLTPPVPLASMRLRLEEGPTPARRKLRIVSNEPARGPVVDLLLDLGTGAGKRQVQVSVMQTSGGFPGLTSQAVTGAAANSRSGGMVAVRSGDTLYGIAQNHAVADATIYQMLVALWRANPRAFIQNNMNRVKAGATIAIPDAATVRAVDPAEARRIFVEQAEAYARYRAGLAGAAARAGAANAGIAGSGKVGDAPGTPPPPQSEDRVRLSSGQPGQSDASSQRQARGDEEVSTAKATEDAQARVDQLESNVRDLDAALAARKEPAQQGGATSQAGADQPGGITLPGVALPSSSGANGAAPNGNAGAAANGSSTGKSGSAVQGSGLAGAPGVSSNAAEGPSSAGSKGQSAKGAVSGQSGAQSTAGQGTGPVANGGTTPSASGEPATAKNDAGLAAGASNSDAAPNRTDSAGIAVSGASGNGAAGTDTAHAQGTSGNAGAGPVGSSAPGVTGDAAVPGDQGRAGTPGGTAGSDRNASGVAPAGSAGSSIASPSAPAQLPGLSSARQPPAQANTAGSDSRTGAGPASQAQAPAESATDGSADSPSGLPSWLSDNLLIVLTAVFALIAFVIAWLLRRAAARRDEDQDDIDDDLYMSPVDEGAIDRRLEGIDLDLDEPPLPHDSGRRGTTART